VADTLATVDELQARLDWVLDSGEQGVAQGALDDLSDDARYHGLDTWDSDTAPRQAKSLVLRAAARFMRNPDGYTQSRAGDETLAWTDLGEQAGTAYFTAQEKTMLASLAGKNTSGLYSGITTAWGPMRHHSHDRRRIDPQTLVPIDGDGAPIPFLTEWDLY